MAVILQENTTWKLPYDGRIKNKVKSHLGSASVSIEKARVAPTFALLHETRRIKWIFGVNRKHIRHNGSLLQRVRRDYAISVSVSLGRRHLWNKRRFKVKPVAIFGEWPNIERNVPGRTISSRHSCMLIHLWLLFVRIVQVNRWPNN